MVFVILGFLAQMSLTVFLLVPVLRHVFPNWSIWRTSMTSALPFPVLMVAAPNLYDPQGSTMDVVIIQLIMALVTYSANSVVVAWALRAWRPL